MLESLLSDLPLGELLSKKPLYYVTRLLMAGVAFSMATNAEKVFARVIGLVWLLIVGGLFLSIGVTKETVGDMLIGVAALGAAGYAWWHTRS